MTKSARGIKIIKVQVIQSKEAKNEDVQTENNRHIKELQQKGTHRRPCRLEALKFALEPLLRRGDTMQLSETEFVNLEELYNKLNVALFPLFNINKKKLEL